MNSLIAIIAIVYLIIGVGFVLAGKSIDQNSVKNFQEDNTLTAFGFILIVVFWPILLIVTIATYTNLRREHDKARNARAKEEPKV